MQEIIDMKRSGIVLFILALCMILAVPFAALAAPVGVITAIEGRADITRGGEPARSAALGDEVHIGDFLRTMSQSRLEVTFIDNSVSRMSPGSRLRVTEFLFDAGDRKSTLDLLRGKVQSVVASATPESTFEVHTPTAVCGVRGTQFIVTFRNGVTRGATIRGTVYTYSRGRPDQIRTMGSGQGFTLLNEDDVPEIGDVPEDDLQQDLDDTTPREGEEPEEPGDEPGDDPTEDTADDPAADPGDTDPGDVGGTVMGEMESGTADGDTTTPPTDPAPPTDPGFDPIPPPITPTEPEPPPPAPEPTPEGDPHLLGFIDGDLYALSDGEVVHAGWTEGELFVRDSDPWVQGKTTPASAQGNYNLSSLHSDEPVNALWLGESFAIDPPQLLDEVEDFNGIGYQTDPYAGEGFGVTVGLWKTDGTLFGETYGLYWGESGNDNATLGLWTDGLTGYYGPDVVGGFEDSSYPGWLAPEDRGTYFKPVHLENFSGMYIDADWLAIDGFLSGRGSNDAFVEGYAWGETFSFRVDYNPLPWGIYFLDFEFDYGENRFSGAEADLSATTLIFGGKSGSYDAMLAETFYPQHSLMLGTVTSAWNEGTITGNVTGTYLSPHSLGSFSGPFYGLYEYDANNGQPTAGSWIGASAGTFQGTDVTFTGFVGGGMFYEGPSSLYVNAQGSLSAPVHESGILGGIGTTPFNSSGTRADYVAMGTIDDTTTVFESGNYLWITMNYLTDEIGYPEFMDAEPTMVSSSAMGIAYTVGLWKANESIQADSFGIYMKHGDSAGLLAGKMTGRYYSDLAMWMADDTGAGTYLTPQEKESTFSEDFTVYTDPVTGAAYGSFGERGDSYFAGSARGRIDNVHLYNPENGSEYETRHWGIYHYLFDGVDRENGNRFDFSGGMPAAGETIAFGSKTSLLRIGEPYDDSFSLGYLSSTWADDGTITGSLFGQYLSRESLGTFSGAFYGLYDYDVNNGQSTAGSWIGASAGDFEGEPLAFGGPTWGYLMYYDGSSSSYLQTAGTGYGLFGGTADTVMTGDDTPLTFMGSYDLWTEERDAYLMYGSGFYFDGGSLEGSSEEALFSGYMVGTWQEGATDATVDARIVSLYIDADGYAGYLTGRIGGLYVPGILMWRADGSVTSQSSSEQTEYVSFDEEGVLTENYFEGRGVWSPRTEGYLPAGSGSFADGGTITVATAVGDPLRISDQNWGIWNAGFGGSYDGSVADSWSFMTGGHYYTPSESFYSGFWIGQALGSSWNASSGIAGSWQAEALTSNFYYEFSGELLGTFGNGDWQAAGIGAYEMTPLEYGGLWGGVGGATSLYYNNNGSLSWAGTDYGRFGLLNGTADSGSYDVVALGYFDGGVNGSGAPYLWMTPIENDYLMPAFEPIVASSTIFGRTGGIWTDEALSGALFALVTRPTEEGTQVGLLGADVAGDVYGSFGMWRAGGETTGTYSDAFDPKYILSIRSYGGHLAETRIAGTFIDEGFAAGSVVGSQYSGMTDFITLLDTETDVEASLPLGLYQVGLGQGNSFVEKPTGATDWSASVGGMGVFGLDSVNDYGYWMASVQGTWHEDGTITGALGSVGDGDGAFGRYLTRNHLGTIQGPFFGLYHEGETTGSGGWIGESLGTYSSVTPLTFAADFVAPIYRATNTGFVTTSWMEGLLASTDSLWTGNDIPVTVMGSIGDSGVDCIWQITYDDRDVSTYDDGAFFGSLAGTKDGEELSGTLFALYVDNSAAGSGAAGYLVGNLEGTAPAGVNLFELDGTVNRIEMMESISVDQSDIDASVTTETVSAMTGSGFFEAGGEILPHTIIGDYSVFNGQNWGMWTSTLFGTFDGDTSDSWSLMIAPDGGPSPAMPDFSHWVHVTGTKVYDREMAGTAAGAWVNWNDAATGVLGGNLKGTFDPSGATWEAVSGGALIETGRFLDMADAGRESSLYDPAALAQLSIPFVEVGRTDLTSSSVYGGISEVYMNDVTFFAYSSGQAPQIWATGSVGGSHSGINLLTPGDAGATLSGAGFYNVDFSMTRWQDNKWGASISGSGTVPDTSHFIDITGAAAGAYTGTESGTFSGAASGVATPTPPEPN